jgi:hypothetical protein
MIAIDLESKIFEEEGKRIEQAFIDACDWLKSLGLFPASNRFITYLKLFEDFRLGRERLMKAPDGLRHYVNATAEASDLIRIRKSLEPAGASDYLAQLRRITSGKAFRDSVGADPGRDFAFELSMASRFLAAGTVVDVTKMADLVVEIQSYKIYVECKRIQSATKLVARLAEARNQIRARIASSPSSRVRGLVAAKVTEILNPESRHAVFPTADLFREKSKLALHSYIAQHEIDFNPCIAKKQLGIFFENSLHGVVYDESTKESVPKFINCRGAAIYRRGLGSEDEALVQAFAPGLANQALV